MVIFKITIERTNDLMPKDRQVSTKSTELVCKSHEIAHAIELGLNHVIHTFKQMCVSINELWGS